MLSDEDSQRLTRSVFGSHQDVTDGGMIARELDGIRTELRALRLKGLLVDLGGEPLIGSGARLMSEHTRFDALDPRALTNAGLATALRDEHERIKPMDQKRDWIYYPLMMEALARLVMVPPRDPLGTARDEQRSPSQIMADALSRRAEPAQYGVRVDTGAGLIAMERQRQIDVEDYDADHDDEHHESQLAWAAVCYAAPQSVYRIVEEPSTSLGTAMRDRIVKLRDPWPWDEDEDKRQKADITPDERERELVKAGALIAAEIDRIRRLHPKSLSATCSVECNGWDRPQGPGHARECPNWRQA